MQKCPPAFSAGFMSKMKIARIYETYNRRIPRKNLQNIAKNLYGNAKLEIIVKKNAVKIMPINRKISVKIDSKFIMPCIKQATSEYAILDGVEGINKEIKIYYKPRNHRT